MPSVVATTNADLKACLVRLRRIGDAASEIVERQDRTDIPAVGDVIEVAVAEATVPARVVQVRAAGAEQIITIEADELSGSYIWDTFTAILRHMGFTLIVTAMEREIVCRANVSCGAAAVSALLRYGTESESLLTPLTARCLP